MNGQIDAALTDLLPEVQQRLGISPADGVDLSGLVNTRITGLSVVVTPAAVATVVPLSAELLQNGTLKTYAGFPHGMPTTQAETINADVLEFIRS